MFAAATDAEAHRLRSSARKATLSLRKGKPCRLPPPDDNFERTLSAQEKAMLDEQGACSAVGAPETVLTQMRAFVEATGVDELMLAAQIYDHQARLQSFEIAMSVWSVCRQENKPIDTEPLSLRSG